MDFVKSNISELRRLYYDYQSELVFIIILTALVAVSDLEWSTPLFYQNGYVVKVNDVAHKVLNM